MFTISRRSLMWAAAGLASASFLGAPVGAMAAGWQDTVASAQKEGKVSLYTSLLPVQVERLSAAFAKAFPGIELRVTRNTENILTQKIMQEQDVAAEGADVLIVTNTDFIDQQIANGKVEKPIGEHVAPFAGTKFLYKDFAPVVASYYVVVAYNADVVKVPPAQFADLVDAARSDEIGLTAVESGSGAALFYDVLRQDLPGYWEKLAKKKIKIFPGAVPLSQAVASGEVGIAIYGVPPALSPLIKKGAPIKLVSPTDARAVGGSFAAQVLKNAKNQAAAQVLVDWMVSPDGQQALNGDGLGMPNSPSVTGGLPPKDFVLLDTKIYTSEKVKAINAEWRGMMGQ